MEEGKVSENHLTSAAAFVEGGIQDACDDSCSICLEPFCDSDPSTLTCCKHEFHLQCVLEWCQRSSQCPMCWQSISLKDPGCQELLEAVEHERNIRMNPPRSTTIFHHPTLGDFELQHLPVNASETELEERIIQHLAAAAAIGRARQLANREGRTRSSQGRPDYLVLSTHANGAPGNSPTNGMVMSPNPVGIDANEEPPNLAPQQHGYTLNNWRTNPGTSPGTQDRAGPSDLQSFSESLKTRLSALSTRYKETISKSTRSWKDRLFARNTSVETSPDATTREVNQNAQTQATSAALSRMMDHLQIAEGVTNPNHHDTTTVTAAAPATAAASE